MGKGKIIGAGLVAISMLALIVCIVLSVYSSPINDTVTVEAGGTGINISRFIKTAGTKAEFVTDMEGIDYSVPASHEIEIRADGKTFTSTLIIVDTTPPVAKGVDRFITADETLEIWDFLDGLYDATELTATYQTEPTFGVCGKTRIVINLTDAAGNKTVVSCNLIISKLISGITLEAGSSIPEAKEFLSVDAQNASYVTDISTIKTNTVKKYDIVISVDGEEFTSTLNVVDTVPPTATPINAVISTDHLLSSYELVKDIVDATSVQVYSYDDRPYGVVGTYTITVTLRDEGDNTTDYPVTVTITNDENLITLRDEA